MEATMASVVLDRIKKLICNPYVKESRKKGGRHPSSASTVYVNEHGETVTAGTCLRKQWYSARHYEESGDRNAEGIMKALAGDLWSQFLVDRVKEAGFWYGDETRFYNQELDISGRVDIIVAEESTGHPVGVEVKSVGTFVSKGVIKPTAAYPLAPKEDHVMQSMIYLHHYKNAIKKWVILYLDRNTMEMAEHIIRIEKDKDGYHFPVISNDMGVKEWKHIRLEDIIKRWQELEVHVKNKTLPDRDYQIQYPNTHIAKLYDTDRLTKTERGKIAKRIESGKFKDSDPPLMPKGDWQCRYCPFVQECYKEEFEIDEVSQEQIDAEL